jgi:GTP-sensing pleiotropic transcriptional regulator CodY
MVTYEKLCTIAQDYAEDIREFRLDGDFGRLMNFIEAVIGADQLVLVNDFYKALTENEKTAFLAIREEIDLSGNISIVKMIQKTNLSRPVWNSLFAKMEKFGIAQIKNQGVKGTHIEIAKEIENGNM